VYADLLRNRQPLAGCCDLGNCTSSVHHSIYKSQHPQMNLSEPFIHRPVATALLMVAVAFVRVAAFPVLPVASLPQIDFPTIQVIACGGTHR
jgi:hypothetical protein